MPHIAFHQIDDEDRAILERIYVLILAQGPSERWARNHHVAELALIDRLRAPSQPDTAAG